MKTSKVVRYRLRQSLSDDIKSKFPELFDGRWRQSSVYLDNDDMTPHVLVKTKDYYGYVYIGDVEIQNEEEYYNEQKQIVLSGSPSREW